MNAGGNVEFCSSGDNIKKPSQNLKVPISNPKGHTRTSSSQIDQKQQNKLAIAEHARLNGSVNTQFYDSKDDQSVTINENDHHQAEEYVDDT